MDAVSWICEIGTGYMFLSWLLSMAIDEFYARRREHRWGRSTAGPDWRAGLWLPGYLGYVRRHHDEIDAREKESARLYEPRPRCPHCGLPHNLGSGESPTLFCAALRARIARERDTATERDDG